MKKLFSLAPMERRSPNRRVSTLARVLSSASKPRPETSARFNAKGAKVFAKVEGQRSRKQCSADFQVCCIAGFQTRSTHDDACAADLEIGDTAGLETCATATGRVVKRFAHATKNF